MTKAYKIEVDCPACADKMEKAAGKTPGVRQAVVSFMTLKMKIDFEDGADAETVMKEVRKNCRKVESGCEVYI
ncbi:MAG: cation transporter [Clostridia bacterium]|nr:cation transporter [Clostridia bacterium]